MADVTDKVIGGFRILAEIKGASGSQGQVFKAICENPPFAGIEPGTVVALKAMAVHDEDGQAWAKLEKRTGELVRLSHRNIVKYYGCFSEPGTFNDTHAIVQEYLEGETLKQRLARYPSGLDADEALHVTEAALAGLAYTAANGIVHRDIKPANIFLCLDKDGAIVGVKLIDFEIARQEGGTTTSASGNLVGSFDYMSPDFTNSTFRGDEQSDVFSMGVVMHEAITGRTPYQRIEGSSGRADFAFLSRWARLHVDGTNPIRISSRANRLLAHSDEVLEKALAPLPQDRYASFAEFHAGLKVIRYRDIKNGDKAYRILQFIGKGGFGEVFKARVKGVGHFVAIKHLLKETYAERFYREAKIMSRLDDPCFVHFVDFFVVHHAGRREAFLVMDFLPGMPGSSLRDAIKRAGGAPLPYRETMLAFARFAHGLCVLHARGIFHRDIKPSNLYIPENHPERAVIMDLGIARDVHGSITTGQVPGTLDYMPPEVVLTENRGEAGMDIYALGLCLYEALSGKTAFPRLPQGAAAITAFLARANIKAMPDLSDPSVMENAPLHELLVRMTHPELSERITDTSAVERALADLAGVEQMPTIPVAEDEVPPVAEEDGTKTRDGFGAAVEEETRPPQDNPYTVNADPKTIKTFETIQQTMQTKPPPPVLDIGRGNEVEDQPGHERRGRFLRGLALAAVAVVACLGAVWACRGWFVADAAVARKEAEAVVRIYAGRGLEDGRVAKEKWLKRWTPRQGDWVVDLDGVSFAACTNRIHAEEVKILDVAAESAAVEVESSYSNTKNATAECDRMFEEWRKEWAQQCSSAKFSELEGRIRKNAQYGRYRRAGIQLTLSYPVVTNTLEACDRQAERWKKIRPDGFPDDEFSKLASNVDKARTKRMETDRKREEERVRENDRRAAESALEEVVKSYAAGTAVGDREAVTWRKNWKEKLDDRVYSEMDAQIATTRANRADIERRQRIQAKKKEFEADCRRIAAGYRDDSSDKAKADAEYDEWVKKWHADRDVPADWRTRLEENVKNEKAAREKRIALADEKVKAAAGVALQEVIQAYDTGNEIGVGDEKAEDWRQAWKEKLSADAYSQMNVQIVSAREKRVNHDEWEKKQRILASKTNEVESVRVALVKDYGNDSGAKKADIDSRFDRWATNWEADEVLRKELPNWFAGRKRTVEEAKKACEARIAEEKRNQLVAAKTNDVVTVRLQLEGAYKTDTSDKAAVDRKFTDWMLKWSADADLPPGWFADQMKPVEREKSAREDRDERKRQEQRAGDEAESVCETYRADGVAVGDGSRKMWNNSWTNTLELAVFLTLSEKIGKAREARVQADEAEAERLMAARAAAQRKADKNRAEEVVARQKAERERERRFSDKTNKVVSVRTQLVNGYKTDASDKARLDKDFTEWVQAWQADAELPPGWFVEQRLAVEREKLAREGRDVVAQQALQQAAQIARQKEQEAAQQRKRASDQAESVCKSYQRFGVVTGDGNRDLWSSTWTNVLDVALFNELSGNIARAREKQVQAEKEIAEQQTASQAQDAARRKAEQERAQRLSVKTNEVLMAREEIVKGYKTDTSDKSALDKRFAEWTSKWTVDADLPSGWFAEQRIAVEREKFARESREAIARQKEQEAARQRIRASDQAESVCKSYQRFGVVAGDGNRDLWSSTWTNVLDAAVFRELSEKIGKARAERRALDDEMGAAQDKARIREKQDQARSVAEDLVRAYENVAIARTETDRSFAAWRDKWSADSDLSADWLSDHRKKVEAAQADRIARDAAEKNRKDAWDDVVRVREKYASGVEKGDSERQLWEGKWKPVLDEATYKNISAIIDKDHKKAVEKAEAERKKAEEERRKAERERLEKDIRAKLSVDRDHVERWKGQLADAEQQIAKGKASGVLDAQNAATLQGEIDQRKKWVVGVVANQSQQEIDVAKRRVAPGQHECFVLEEGMPAGGLQVTCEGYKPLVIDEVALDGEIVAIGSGKWTLVPVPKARVQVPALEDGVACLVDGRERSGEFELASGGHAYVYRLAGHEDQKGTFSAKAGEVMKLPVPGEWRADKTLEDAFTRNLKDVEKCLDVDDGEFALRIYHEIQKKGYRLTEDDRANVEQAYEICKGDYAKKLQRAIKDPRFDEAKVRTWWAGVLKLYNDLTSKK